VAALRRCGRAMRGAIDGDSSRPLSFGVRLAVGLRSAQPWRMLGFFFENIRHHLRIVDIGTTIDTLNRAKGACPAPSTPTHPCARGARCRQSLCSTTVAMAGCLLSTATGGVSLAISLHRTPPTSRGGSKTLGSYSTESAPAACNAGTTRGCVPQQTPTCAVRARLPRRSMLPPSRSTVRRTGDKKRA
jgi:hypothetical protein